MQSSSTTASAATDPTTVGSTAHNESGNGNANTSRSGSRSGSRRHRSRSHGHHRHRSRRRRHNPKRAERNLVAAVLGFSVIIDLIAALAHQKWFHLHGGKCGQTDIGAFTFLIPGIETKTVYEHCFNPLVVSIMRSVIAFIFLAITSSLFAFFLDTLGPMKPSLRLIRRHAVGNIVAALLCLTMLGFSYWSAAQMEEILTQDKLCESSKVVVSFGIGYYLVVVSGALSVITAATNLLRPYSSYDDGPRERLMDDWDQLLEAELASMPNGPPVVNQAHLPEPPAYTP